MFRGLMFVNPGLYYAMRAGANWRHAVIGMHPAMHSYLMRLMY